MANEKNHSLKHGGGDVAKWGDPINMSCDAPETAHKLWIKEQGDCTNQGPAAQLTMLNHTLQKEASDLLCEAVEGMFRVTTTRRKKCSKLYCILAARVDDGDDAAWTQRNPRTGELDILRADRFYGGKKKRVSNVLDCKGMQVNIWNRAKQSRCL